MIICKVLNINIKHLTYNHSIAPQQNERDVAIKNLKAVYRRLVRDVPAPDIVVAAPQIVTTNKDIVDGNLILCFGALGFWCLGVWFLG
jgi:hypothetical protein